MPNRPIAFGFSSIQSGFGVWDVRNKTKKKKKKRKKIFFASNGDGMTQNPWNPNISNVQAMDRRRLELVNK